MLACWPKAVAISALQAKGGAGVLVMLRAFVGCRQHCWALQEPQSWCVVPLEGRALCQVSLSGCWGHHGPLSLRPPALLPGPAGNDGGVSARPSHGAHS